MNLQHNDNVEQISRYDLEQLLISMGLFYTIKSGLVSVIIEDRILELVCLQA